MSDLNPPVNPTPNHPNDINPQDSLTTPLKVLSFCIPLAGAIIYFTSKDKLPNKAKSACHAALWGAGVGIVLNIIFTVLGVGAGMMQ